ncbi:hypothetical protein RKD21_006060 [Streptomyces albogriseolus]|uniref:Uncharacterized protein n=1 Tax=Streptomyces albogriseolus TaxID=1887 RepID=A0ACC6UWK6_STRAO
MAEATITPRTRSRCSASRAVTASSESMNAAFMVFTDWPGSSRTRVTTPVSSCSQRMVVDSVLIRMRSW